MFELLGQGLVGMMATKYLIPLVLGTLVGVVGGALPGITITMTIIVVLPFTFGLEPLQGLAAMIGVYVGGETGGLITSCLLGIPGKPSAVATMFDGFPMAKKGEPGRALWLGIWASIFGGLIGAVVLVASTGPLAKLALEFGPWEYFSLFVLALSMVAGLVESSLAKGLVSGGIGLIITILGNDPVMGKERLTLGISGLDGGIPFLPVLIGVFAFAQVMGEVERMGGARAAEAKIDAGLKLVVSHTKVIGEILARPFTLLWASFIGLVIGVRWMLKIVSVPKSALFPVVLVLCVIGAYALNNTMSSVWILAAFGVFGYGRVKFGCPLAPFILGVILGSQIEINLIRAIMTDANPWLFLTRPISGGLLVAAVLSFAAAIWQHRRQQRASRAPPADGEADF